MFKRLAATAALAAAGFLALAAPASADTHDVTANTTVTATADAPTGTAGHILDLTASVFVQLGLL